MLTNYKKKTVFVTITIASSMTILSLNYMMERKSARGNQESPNNNLSQLDVKTSEQFQDQMFKPILELFKQRAKGELKPRLKKSGKIPKVYLWSQPFDSGLWDAQVVHIRQNQCPLPCKVTYDIRELLGSDAIVIYLRGAKSATELIQAMSPRDPNQPWIMVTFEAPTKANDIHGSNYTGFNSLFNRTMMYRRDADIRVPHGFIVQRGQDADSLPSSWVLPPKMDYNHPNRTKLAVAFISNCHAHSDRLKYISKVQKYAQIDVYGKCGQLKCGHSMYANHQYSVTTNHCFKKAGEEYLFFLAFENSYCLDYITEKAYNLLYYSMVPVVLGSADYSTLFPPNSYIDASLYSPKELAEKLLYLQAHPMEYNRYLEWRKTYQPSTIGGERVLCHLCARLYDPEFYEYNVVEDFEDWFVSKSRCVKVIDL